MPDTTYQPKVYRKSGGDTLVVASGGAIQVESGGTITVGGTDLIGELAALDGLDATELGYINGVVAGTVTASKALVVGADKNVDTLVIADSGLKLGSGAGTAVSKTAAQINALVGGVAGSYRLARGVHTTVDEDDTVVTGLTTVVAVVVSLESDPVAGAQFATGVVGNQAGAPAAGSIQIKTWKATAAGDTALIAATTFSKLVNWIAIGT